MHGNQQKSQLIKIEVLLREKYSLPMLVTYKIQATGFCL